MRSRALLAFAISIVALVACGDVLSAADPGTQPGPDATAPDAAPLVDSAVTDSPTIHSNGDLFMETSGGDLIGCRTSGCPASVKKLAHENAFAESNRVSGSNVAVDANHIYYVARDGDPDAGTATYRLMRLPRKPL